MIDLNKAYLDALSACEGQADLGDDNKIHVYHYQRETEESIINKLFELMKLKKVIP